MPYIKKEDRNTIYSGFLQPRNCGELNYKITKIILNYLPKDPHYKDYNEVVGVLECCK